MKPDKEYKGRSHITIDNRLTYLKGIFGYDWESIYMNPPPTTNGIKSKVVHILVRKSWDKNNLDIKKGFIKNWNNTPLEKDYPNGIDVYGYPFHWPEGILSLGWINEVPKLKLH